MKINILQCIVFIDILIVGCFATDTTTIGIYTTDASTTSSPTNPTNNTYRVFEPDSNKTCLMVTMDVSFNYTGKIVNVSSDANVVQNSSSCSSLMVDFGNVSYFVLNWNTTSGNMYELTSVEAYLGQFEVTGINESLHWGKTSKKDSYFCAAGENINLSNFTMAMTNVQMQAFEVSGNKFGREKNCDSDLSPIIPIVVGAVLALLVVIVIIAYLIGRRRSRSGYEEI